MFRTADGPLAGTGRNRPRLRHSRRADRLYYALSLGMAASSLGMGLLGGIVLFNLGPMERQHSSQTDAAIAPDRLAAEIVAQRQKMAEQDALRSPANSLPAKETESDRMLPPVASLPLIGIRPMFRRHTQRRKFVRPRRNAKSPPPVPSSPSFAELRIQAIADEVDELRHSQVKLFDEMAKVNTPLASYLAEQIAAINVEQKTISNRVAVTENAARRLQEGKSWFDWLAIGVTAGTVIQGLLGFALAILDRRRTVAPPAGSLT